MLPCEHFALDNARSASRLFVGYNLDFLGLPPYSTVGNFRGRKLLQISEKHFCGKTFIDASLVPSKDAASPNFTEKIITKTCSHKTLKFAVVFSLESFLLYSICI